MLSRAIQCKQAAYTPILVKFGKGRQVYVRVGGNIANAKLQMAITLIVRCESKTYLVKSLVSTHSAYPCKNCPPKCSQLPHEYRLLSLLFFLLVYFFFNFFDLRKAFDSVSHSLLLQRLEEIGINQYLVQWIHSYLSSWSQSVVVGGEESPVLPVISGVLQGSVLGPLLFIIFINEIAHQIYFGSSISFC